MPNDEVRVKTAAEVCGHLSHSSFLRAWVISAFRHSPLEYRSLDFVVDILGRVVLFLFVAAAATSLARLFVRHKWLGGRDGHPLPFRPTAHRREVAGREFDLSPGRTHWQWRTSTDTSAVSGSSADTRKFPAPTLIRLFLYSLSTPITRHRNVVCAQATSAFSASFASFSFCFLSSFAFDFSSGHPFLPFSFLLCLGCFFAFSASSSSVVVLEHLVVQAAGIVGIHAGQAVGQHRDDLQRGYGSGRLILLHPLVGLPERRVKPDRQAGLEEWGVAEARKTTFSASWESSPTNPRSPAKLPGADRVEHL